MGVIVHYCPECGTLMQKVRGTKGQYKCRRCGVSFNPSKKRRLRDK